ncbi:MAG: YIP1 family protein [Anaerolineales bacterium]
MTETALPPLEQPRRFQFDWVLPTLLRPRATLAKIVEYAGDCWLTPLLVVSLAEIARVIAAGNVRGLLASTGQVPLPPGSEFWTPEQQAQFLQAQQAASSPVFLYVFPGIVALLGVWIGWVLMSALLHLLLTMLGGRSATRAALNVVAWASLPLAVRAIARATDIFIEQKLIVAAGFSGYVSADGGAVWEFIKAVLASVDIFLIWHLVLVVIGARQASGLSLQKVAASTLITALIVLALQALPGFIFAQLSGLQTLPIFF